MGSLAASLLLPWFVVFGVFFAAGVAGGQLVLLVPVLLGVAFVVAWTLGDHGDTAASVVVAWLILTVLIGEAGVVVGSKLRRRRRGVR